MISQIPISSLELGLIIIVVILFALFKPLTSPLRSIPGPWLARFTRAWLFREAYRSTFPFTNIELHRKYGRIVRIAPNEYSIDDPAAAKIIYGSGKGYIKSPWYKASKNLANVIPGLFDERDPHIHSGWRRKVAAAYAMSSLVQSEPFVDECTSLFQKRLSEFAKDGTLFDMAHWLQCYAFDVIGMITFGDRFGFLNNGEDIEGVMVSIDDFLKYAVRVGIFSEWHPILFWYKVLQKSTSGLVHIRKFSRKRLDARWAKPSVESAEFDADAPADFITKFLRIRAADPTKISKDEVATVCGTNVGAGSDTTSISLISVIFHLCKYPETLSRLRSEIDGMVEQGLVSNPVTYQEAQQMPYLQAVIKEALRLHPATGLILGRVVPEGGAELAGQFFPGGTVVGINTWVAHRNKEVFGADVDEFRPERWLEEDHEVVKRREAYFLTFGQGSRTCIGKNISLMEMSKVIPQLVRNFHFFPEGGEPSWRLENVWFVKPKDFKLRVKLRNTND